MAWRLLLMNAVVWNQDHGLLIALARPRALYLLLGLGIYGCGSSEISTAKVLVQSTEQKAYIPTPQDYQKAAISVTSTLTDKKANSATIATITDKTQYEAYLRQLLNSKDFAQVMVKYHQKLFQNLGKNLALTVAQNDPAIYGAYVASSDGVPYSDILVGNYCVILDPATGNLTQGSCRTTAGVTPSPQNSGVLTIPALLAHDFGAQNIRNAARAIERFVCVPTTTPDAQDAGRPYTEISPRYGGEMFGILKTTPSQGSECFFCHGSLTNRAVTFRNFESNGSYNPARTIRDVELPFVYNTTGMQCPTAQQPACTNFPNTHSISNSTYKGVAIDQVWDLGREIAKDPRFDECATVRFYNWVFGKENALSPVESSIIAILKKSFTDSNRSIKELLFALLSNNDIYIARQALNGGTP